MTEEDYYDHQHDKGKRAYYVSLSGKYDLTVSWYTTKPGCWDVSRGIVTDKNHKVIADVKRNYGSFWYCFVQHQNGYEYLLCGEDYQGYTVINLDTGNRIDYLPPEAKQGWGFCWIDCEAIDYGTKLVVNGCFWGAPYERVIYDFSNPETLPLPELDRLTIDLVTDDEEDEDHATGYESR